MIESTLKALCTSKKKEKEKKEDKKKSAKIVTMTLVLWYIDKLVSALDWQTEVYHHPDFQSSWKSTEGNSGEF